MFLNFYAWYIGWFCAVNCTITNAIKWYSVGNIVVKKASSIQWYCCCCCWFFFIYNFFSLPLPFLIFTWILIDSHKLLTPCWIFIHLSIYSMRALWASFMWKGNKLVVISFQVVIIPHTEWILLCFFPKPLLDSRSRALPNMCIQLKWSIIWLMLFSLMWAFDCFTCNILWIYCEWWNRLSNHFRTEWF